MTALHGLFVGVDRYADPSIGSLRFARKDAETLAAAFRSSIDTDDLRLHVLVDEEATRANILDLVGRGFGSDAGVNDMVLVYFAGHGSPELVPGLDESSRFLVCHDSRRDALFSTSIDLASDLPRLLSRLRARLRLFVLDACFSGYSGGRGIVGAHLERWRLENRTGIRLRELPLGRGTAVMSAANDDEVAAEPSALQHGVFTYHLLSSLKAPGDRTVIPLSTLYDKVFTEVNRFTEGRQNPVLWGTLIGAGLPRLGALGS